MISLKLLHEQFIERARRPSLPGRLPVSSKEPEAPVLMMDRWKQQGSALLKSYTFRSVDHRDGFIVALLAYERTVQHRAKIFIDNDSVSLSLETEGVSKPTELDKEYAAYADVLFKDIVQGVVSRHGDEDRHITFADE